MSHADILCLSPRSAALRVPARGCARPCAAPSPLRSDASYDACVSFYVFNHVPRERLVREARFTIERDELVTFTEPEGDATFQWILAHS